MIEGLFDLLWPRVCPVCAREIDGGASRRAAHSDCVAALPPAPAPTAAAVPVRARFLDAPGWFALLHAWKYGGQRELACVVARAMATYGPPPDPAGHRLVPLPDDPVRRTQRGYSPVGDLTRALSETTGIAVESDLLHRKRPRRSQTSCRDDAERHRNVTGVFRIGDLARCARERTLILVDDQVTSGATVTEAARLLRVRGNRVSVWCAARAARAPASLA